MRMAYVLSHWGLQSALTSVLVITLTFFQIIFVSGLTTAMLLGALLVSTIFVYAFLDIWLRIQKGKGKTILSIVLRSGFAVIFLYFTGIGTIIFANLWLYIMIILIVSDIFAHVLLRAAGANN